MSIFSKIRNKFRRKKYDNLEDLEKLTKGLPPAPQEISAQTSLQEQDQRIHMDNVKARLDLILTELDNLKMHSQMAAERLKNIEKTLADMRGIKYY